MDFAEGFKILLDTDLKISLLNLKINKKKKKNRE